MVFTESGSPTLVGFGDAQLLDLTATGRAVVAARAGNAGSGPFVTGTDPPTSP